MKELTVGKREAIDVVKQMVADGQISQDVAEKYFPEIKESEDEKIRKTLIEMFRNVGKKDWRNIPTEKIIAWLEKQKEFVSADFDDVWETADCEELTAPLEKYSKDAIKNMCHAWYDKGIELERKSWFEKQDKQKPQGKSVFKAIKEEKVDNQNCVKGDDKVTPNFKVGDWIISNNKKSIYQVIEVKRGIYVIRDNVNNHEYHIGIEECEKSGRIWSISDAKDGDVLFLDFMSGKTFIYNGVNPDNAILYSFIISNDGKDVLPYHIGKPNTGIGIIEESKNIIYPATKEQRDLLFQKMKEAGYEWDPEKREPKKIEYKSAWSEEDELFKIFIDDAIEVVKECYTKGCGQEELVAWLKSLKERYTWKPSDKQMNALDSTLQYSQVSHDSFEHLNSLFNDLKKLKER